MTDQGRLNAVVTGCASGIGRHLGRSLARRGHRVWCTDIDLEGVDQWVEALECDRGEAVARRLDVRSPEDWRRELDEAAGRFGSVDVLMNVAGYLEPGYIGDASEGDVDMHIDVNVKGVVHGTRIAARRMVDRGFGHIINIGSLASLSPVPGLSLYGASKFAVRGFSLSVAEELRDEGVDVSVVLLDAVRTPMLELQAECEAAALTFSGDGPLELEEVEALMFEKVLVDRPLEVTLPRRRGLLARLAGMVPEVARWLTPWLKRRGRRAQQLFETD